jgi:hypothetical protein
VCKKEKFKLKKWFTVFFLKKKKKKKKKKKEKRRETILRKLEKVFLVNQKCFWFDHDFGHSKHQKIGKTFFKKKKRKKKSPRNKQSLRPKYQGWIIFSPKKTYEGQGNKVKYPKGHGNM